VPRLPGDRGDLDGAVGYLGHLEGEQLAHQVGVGARQHDRRPAHALAHLHDIATQPGAVFVVLPRHLLRWRQHRLDLSQVDKDVARVLSLLDHAGHDVALAAGELAERLLVLGVAQPLQDDLLGGGGSDPPEPGRCVVVLAEHRALVVGLRRPNGDVTALALELDARGGLMALGALVGDEQRLLDGLDQGCEGDLLLALQRAQRAHVDVHVSPPPARRDG
jgi:hypothetical protein